MSSWQAIMKSECGLKNKTINIMTKIYIFLMFLIKYYSYYVQIQFYTKFLQLPTTFIIVKIGNRNTFT